MSRVQNDARKIVKPKDRTEGIARMMVIDLRFFDIVEDELFKLVPNPFPESHLFRESRNFRDISLVNSEWLIFGKRSTFVKSTEFKIMH